MSCCEYSEFGLDNSSTKLTWSETSRPWKRLALSDLTFQSLLKISGLLVSALNPFHLKLNL